MTEIKELFTEKIFLGATLFSSSIVFFIFGFMIYLGLPLFREGHFFELLHQPWAPHAGSYGIGPMIAGTLAISLLALFIAFPICLGCSAFISLFGPPGVGRFVRLTVEMMTGIPTVIYGFIGIFLLVPFLREIFDQGSGMCWLSASLMLALLISPTMILFFTDHFNRVPVPYLHCVDALGGSRAQKFLYVILPCSWRGIMTGTILALGRALGDTLIGLMIAGNAVQTPNSLFDSIRTLTAHIALIFASDFESMEFKAIFACGLFLFFLTSILVISARLLADRTGSQA